MTIFTWLLAALGHSVGWGIRGNFGHEAGAMMAGCLGTMGAVLLTQRPDWHRRAAVFAVLGAIGWSFGGSISYMQVVAYTHSGHWPSQLYGFAALFLTGACWGAPGGTGMGIAATWSGRGLADLFRLTTVVFTAWYLQGWHLLPMLLERLGNERFRELTYWYDTDWIAAAVATLVLALWSLPRCNRNAATRLGWAMAIGWWAGFLVFVNLIGLRMTPPRGDNWAGCTGMIIAIYFWSIREKMLVVSLTTLVCGLCGGLSFAAAPMLKLSLTTSGYDTNWHSVMEQLTGFMHGLGVAWALWLANRATRPEMQSDQITSSEMKVGYFWQSWCVAFVWLFITFVNLWKNAEEWVKQGAMAARLYGLEVLTWFEFGYVGLSITVCLLLWRHHRRPMALIPDSAIGKGQLIYLVFLWWICIGNFDRAQVKFADQRLITEGVIFLNAMLCTALLLLNQPVPNTFTASAGSVDNIEKALRRMGALAIVMAVCGIAFDFAVVRGIFGDKFAGHASLHIRFGPRNTIQTGPR